MYDILVYQERARAPDDPASFTNFGDWVEVAAPGVDIYSTMPTYNVTLTPPYSLNYDYLSGTSMACPHVAGVVALILSRYPYMTRDSVRYWLRYAVDDQGPPEFDTYYGYGRINAHTAVESEKYSYDLVALGLDASPTVQPNASTTVKSAILNLGLEDVSARGIASNTGGWSDQGVYSYT